MRLSDLAFPRGPTRYSDFGRFGGQVGLIEEMREPGEWIHGKYQVQRVLGAGGMGTVYATKRRNESLAAVKVLHPQFAHDKSIRARFLEEGYLANRVGHPAVVSIVEDDIDEEGNFYIVMELLDGVDLSQFVGPPRQPITTAQALNIADQLLAALVQAHQKGIVHLDIKPANVMLLRDGRVMLLDFGIAKALGGEGLGVGLDDEEEGAGTDRYMSPEQGNGSYEEIDARADLWSVGALLMALLADQDPEAVPLWDQSYEDRAWSFSRLGQGVPPHVVQILSLALQPQKANRWVSAAAMKEAVYAAHLNLYGPITRDALAQLIALKLGEAPPESRQQEGSSDQPIVAIDPTFPSRPSHTDLSFPSRPSAEVVSSRPATRKSRPSQFSNTPSRKSSPALAREHLPEPIDAQLEPGWPVVSPAKKHRTWALGLLLFALGASVALWVAKMGTSHEVLTPPADEASSTQPRHDDGAERGKLKKTEDSAQVAPVYLDNLPADPVAAGSRPARTQADRKAPTAPNLPSDAAKTKENTTAGPTTEKNTAANAVPASKKDKECNGLDGLFNVEHCE